MSSIDKYQHRIIGFIECPSDYDIVHNNSTRKIPLYQLGQHIPEEEQDFDGKMNDIILGGGRGEVEAFRISNPSAFLFFTEQNVDSFDNYDALFKSFWSPNQSFKLCNGFLKSGWSPEENIELWLAEQICNVLIKHVPEYAHYTRQRLDSRIEFIKL